MYIWHWKAGYLLRMRAVDTRRRRRTVKKKLHSR
jgi:hypothetical protein